MLLVCLEHTRLIFELPNNFLNVDVPGPVIMNTEGFTEKGIKRKAAVQALFSKLLYLSEVSFFTLNRCEYIELCKHDYTNVSYIYVSLPFPSGFAHCEFTKYAEFVKV